MLGATPELVQEELSVHEALDKVCRAADGMIRAII